MLLSEKAGLLIAADICVPELGLPFELHVTMAVKQSSMTGEDLRELLRHVAPLAGYNIVAMAFERSVAILAGLGVDVQSTSKPSQVTGRIYAGAAFSDLRAVDPALASMIETDAASLWHREGITRRERCFATLAVHVVHQTIDAPFQEHLRICREAGLTKDECAAAIRMLAEFSSLKAWRARLALEQLYPPETE
jgi:alkylhydroperoxidase/carboxymuconolactone decarboxylase family protein YurZ